MKIRVFPLMIALLVFATCSALSIALVVSVPSNLWIWGKAIGLFVIALSASISIYRNFPDPISVRKANVVPFKQNRHQGKKL